MLLSSQSDFLVIGQARDWPEAVSQLRKTATDILLLDGSALRWPQIVPAATTGSQSRACRTIVLAGDIGQEDVVRLLGRGVRGILSKHSPIELIFKCIRRVHHGEVWVGRKMMASIVDAMCSSIDHVFHPPPPALRLTRREHEILQLVVQGEANKSIAERLAVSADTVKHHLTNIFDKTGASSRLELAMFAVHHRLVPVA